MTPAPIEPLGNVLVPTPELVGETYPCEVQEPADAAEPFPTKLCDDEFVIEKLPFAPTLKSLFADEDLITNRSWRCLKVEGMLLKSMADAPPAPAVIVAIDS